METIKIPTKIVGTEILFEADVKGTKFDVYWDQHGNKVYHDEHPCLKTGPCHVKIECIHRILFDDLEDDLWHMYINGKKVTIGMIQGYRLLKSGILKVDAPWGAG